MNCASPLRVGLCGALGGAINAWLCYAQLPVSVGHFKWHVIPAGAMHGGVLALGAFGFALLLLKHTPGVRLVAAPLIAWITGFVAWIPLNASVFDDPWVKNILWPFQQTWTAAVIAPFMCFGLVVLFYYLCLSFFAARASSLSRHLLCASTAGILGSLWWWISWEGWYLCLLHGAIWGACVGTATWQASRSDASIASSVA